MDPLVGSGLALLAGAMQGAFPLPMKYAAKWKWENIWSVFALWGFVVFPWLLAFLTVPNLLGVYANASGSSILAMTLFGLGWGIGTICFGIGISMVGLALGFAIVIGMTGALGTLLPMILFHPEAFLTCTGLTVTGGVFLMLVGVCVCALAGSQREMVSSTTVHHESKPAERGAFRRGLIICIISGIASPMLNFAFIFGDEIISNAKAAGASPAHASNPIWCWAMTSAFVATVIYCMYLMRKDRGWYRYAMRGTGGCWGLTLLMGILFSSSIAIYGIALSGLGYLSASIGWPILMTSSVVTGNICGMATGEWRDVGRKPLLTLLVGLVILVLAICVIGAGQKASFHPSGVTAKHMCPPRLCAITVKGNVSIALFCREASNYRRLF